MQSISSCRPRAWERAQFDHRRSLAAVARELAIPGILFWGGDGAQLVAWSVTGSRSVDCRLRALTTNIPLDPGMRREDDLAADVCPCWTGASPDQCAKRSYRNTRHLRTPRHRDQGSFERHEVLVKCDRHACRWQGQQVLGEGTWFLATQMEQWDSRISCRRSCWRGSSKNTT